MESDKHYPNEQDGWWVLQIHTTWVDMKQITTEESNKQQMINLKMNSVETWRREKRWDLVSSICWSLSRNPDGSAIASPVSLLGYSGLEMPV